MEKAVFIKEFFSFTDSRIFHLFSFSFQYLNFLLILKIKNSNSLSRTREWEYYSLVSCKFKFFNFLFLMKLLSFVLTVNYNFYNIMTYKFVMPNTVIHLTDSINRTNINCQVLKIHCFIQWEVKPYAIKTKMDTEMRLS